MRRRGQKELSKGMGGADLGVNMSHSQLLGIWGPANDGAGVRVKGKPRKLWWEDTEKEGGTMGLGRGARLEGLWLGRVDLGLR